MISRILSIAVAFVLLSAPAKASGRRINYVIQTTTEKLLNIHDFIMEKEWTGPKVQAPQVIYSDTAIVHGGCRGTHGSLNNVQAGSSYCPYTNTIFMHAGQMDTFYRRYGDGAVSMVVAHEWAHAMQWMDLAHWGINPQEIGTTAGTIKMELQADCIAGNLIRLYAQSVGWDQGDSNEAVTAAYHSGDSTHGTGKQRANALNHGLAGNSCRY